MAGLAGKMAVHAINKEAESLLSPLLSVDESSTEEGTEASSSSTEVEKQSVMQMLKTAGGEYSLNFVIVSNCIISCNRIVPPDAPFFVRWSEKH